MTDVTSKDKDRIVVEFQKRQFELVSIDDKSTKEILDSARKPFGDRWKKRFSEDLVEVMAGMGRRPGGTVKLVLRDPKADKTITVDKAPMTEKTRDAVDCAVNARTNLDRNSEPRS